jgi:perosamine synthetase
MNRPTERIPVSGPWITQKEIDYVAEATANAWYSNANVYNQRFENAFANYLNVQHTMSLPSCTSAIHLALAGLGIGPGDEVIVPEITWIASAAPISYVGATPIFADVDPQTWCLSAESFEAWITPRTKAVIPVDLYGNMPDMDALLAIAAKHGIYVIEDAAEAVGATYSGKRAGSFGEASVFSFHGSKTLTTGEGGLLATNNDALYQRALFLRDHGRAPGNRMFYNSEVAYKYRMSSLQAALGLAQLERVEELVSHKRQIFRWYQAELEHCTDLQLNSQAPTTENAYWMVTIVDTAKRLAKERLMELMSAEQIDCRPFFYPLSSLPAYSNLPHVQAACQRNQVSYDISPYAINLPSGLNLTEEKVHYVCDTLKRLLGHTH